MDWKPSTRSDTVKVPAPLPFAEPRYLPGADLQRFARLAATALGVPAAAIVLRERVGQYPAHVAALARGDLNEAQLDLGLALCRATLENRRPLVLTDAREHPLVQAVRQDSTAIGAYLGAPLRSPKGRVAGSIAVFATEPRDWTDRELRLVNELADAVLHEIALASNARSVEDDLRGGEAVLDSIGEAVIVTRPDGTITYWNRAAEELYGWQAREVVGRNVVDVTPSDMSREQAGYIMERIRVGQRWSGEFSLQRRDGSSFPAYVTDTPIYDGSGKLVGIIGVSVDITEQKRAEAGMHEEAQLIDLLHHTGSTLVAELNLQKVVQAVTDVATALTGAAFGSFFYNVINDDGESYTLYTLSGVPLETFEGFPMPRNTAIFGPTFRGEGIMRLDDVTQDPRFGQNPPYFGMPEGHLPVRSYLAVPVLAGEGEVLGGLFFGHPEAGVFTDRAERLAAGIAAQAAIAIQNAQLYQTAQEATRAREEFLAVAAHELRTPLTSTKGFMSLINRELVRDEPDIRRLRRFADQLKTQVRRLEVLVADLLDVSRIHQGRLELRFAETDLAALARSVLNRFQDAPERGPRHLLTQAGEPTLVGVWDPDRIDQLLTNLVSNALRYSPEGGEVRLTLLQAGDEVVAEVADEGIGISHGDQARLFQPFQRAGSAQNISGTGLGLYISRQIAEQHGGSLDLSSEPGRGSTFTVRLPRWSGPQSTQASASIDSVEPQSPAAN